LSNPADLRLGNPFYIYKNTFDQLTINMKRFLLFFTISIFYNSYHPLLSQSLSFRHDKSDNGYYEGGNFNGLKPAWSYKTGSSIRSTPLLKNNSVFFGNADSIFYRLNLQDGRLLWKFKASAAISSSAATFNGLLFFQDRNNFLYALYEATGKEKWHLRMGISLSYEWAFDYYLSSPAISNDHLFIGSGDGNCYSINIQTGKIEWKFISGSVIRSSPLISNGFVYFGDCDGKVYCLDAAKGKKVWQFNTIGDTLNNEKEGFDRKAIIASPVIKNNTIIVGGRDGYLYALDAKTGSQLWKYNYNVSWVISTVAIKDSIVISGTSDGQIVNALNFFSGKEIWQKPASLVWSSPIIIGNSVITAQMDGCIYIHDLLTGKQKDKVRVGDRFLSSPVYNNGKILVGNDDGNFYAFSAIENSSPRADKAVFYNKDFSTRKTWLDAYIKDYFVAEGYELLDENKLTAFLNEHIKNKKQSVIVLATNYFPQNTISTSGGSPLIRQYLQTGGKIVTTGANPATFVIDSVTHKMVGLDYSLSKSLTDVEYPYSDLRSHKGFYPASPTSDGVKWGLTRAAIGHSGIKPSFVTPLSVDENGNATYWVKNYGFKEGTGLVQFWITPDRLDLINDLRRVAEYGMK